MGVRLLIYDNLGKLGLCGYIFHREHISERIADQDYCPTCFNKVEEEDLNLERSCQ